MALTPEQLAAIQQGLAAQYSATGGGEAGSSFYQPSQTTVGGMNYVPDGSGGYWGFQDNPDWNSGDKIANYNGTPYTSYDAKGNEVGSGKLSGISNDNFMKAWGPFIATAALMAPAVAPGLGAAMSFGVNPVTGAAATGGAAGTALGGSGAFLGEGASSGIPAWDAAAGSGVAGAGGAGAAGGALQTLGGVPQVTIPAASTFPELTTSGSGLLGKGAAGLLTSLGVDAATASKLAPLLGMGLGALAGSQGQKTSQNSVKSMDPRMDSLFYGDLAPKVQGLLAQQTSPQAMQGWQQIQNTGMGLLANPVAGNGFSRFFPGK
jgi:hypothetical protein